MEENNEKEKQFARIVSSANLIMYQPNFNKMVMSQIKERKSRQIIFKAKSLSVLFFSIELGAGMLIYLFLVRPFRLFYSNEVSISLIFQIGFLMVLIFQAEFIASMFRPNDYEFSKR